MSTDTGNTTSGNALDTTSSDIGNTTSGNGFHTISNELSTSTIVLLHEATLQDLLRCSNDAVLHLLWERNDLLRER